MKQYLVTITAYDPALPGTRTLYFSTAGYTTKTSETPASTFYDPCIVQPALMRRDAFSKGTTTGKSQIGYGELILSNADGHLDYLMTYGLDGRAILEEVGEGAYPGGFTTVLKGTMEQAEFTWSTVVIRIRDKQELLNVPIQPTKYAGTNALPAGEEGVDDLKGKPKPLVFGSVYNISPPCVNTSKLIYQVNDGAVTDIPNAYDRGVAFTRGADYASVAAMEATAPAAGNYRVYPAGGYFRLNASPKGVVTCDVLQGTNAAARTVAQLYNTILTTKGGISSGDISSSDLTALDTANSAVVGVYIDSEENITAVLDKLSNSVGAYWGVDATGVFRIKQLVAPSGSPVLTIEKTDIIDKIQKITTNDTDNGLPAYKVQLNYSHNYTMQDGEEIAGTAATDVYRAFSKEEWRKVISVDSSVQTTHLLAPQIVFDTYLTTVADAQNEADRRLTLYKTRRDRIDLRLKLDATLISTIDLGRVVSLTIPRFGFTSGKLFVILGIQYDARSEFVDLTLWG